MPSAANAVSQYVIGYRDARSGRPADPNPKQFAAHCSEADELLFGGAAFGGKSEFIIWDAIATCLEYPGCEVAIFRRSHTELEHSLIQRFLRYVPASIAKYVGGSKMCARFKNGSILWFCHCHTERSVYRYQSDEWVALYIDQAEHFTESMVTYLFSRVRTSKPGIRCKIRLSANPGGIGHAWLKARYIAPPPEITGDRPLPLPGEVWAPLANPLLPDDRPLSRQFIPAKLTDNRAGCAADPIYVQRIRANPSEMHRRMLEDGDWDAFEGQMFSMWKASKLVAASDARLVALGLPPGLTVPWHVIPDPHWEPPTNTLVFGSVDYGYGNPWSAHLHASMPDGHIVTFREFYGVKVQVEEQASRIRAYLESQWETQQLQRRPKWHVEYIVMDASMWGSRMEHGLAKSRAEVYEDVLGIPCEVNIRPAPAGPNSRKSRLQQAIGGLSTAPDGFPWVQFTTACPNAIRTIPQLVVDPNDPDDILHGTGDKKQEDHCVAGETLVHTTRGLMPIAALPGAWVSRENAETLIVQVEGAELRCTPDQRLLTSAGWQRAEDLRPGSEILWWSTPVARRLAGTASIAADSTSSAWASGCTEPSGSPRTEPFRPVFTSTIETPTEATTLCRISNSWKDANTCLIIPDIRRLPSGPLAGRTPSDPVPPVIAVCQQHNGVRRVLRVARASNLSRVYDLCLANSLHAYVSNRGFLTHNCYDDWSYFLGSRPPFPKPDLIPEHNRYDLGTSFGLRPPSARQPGRVLDARAFGRQR